MDTKQCSKCGEVKGVELFPKTSRICKVCRATYRHDFYLKTKERYKGRYDEKRKIWLAENPDKIKSYSRKYYELHKSEIIRKQLPCNRVWRNKNADKVIAYQRAACEKMHDSYIAKTLLQSGFPSESITPELIETKRLIIKTKRYVKSKTNSSTKHSGTTLQNG